MQSSKTVTSDEQEVDVESFIETENSVNLGESNGTARLESCDVSKNPPEGLPQDYKDEYTSFSYDEYFVFDAKTVEDCSKDIQVVLPAEEAHEEIDIAYGWTDASSVSDLAGSVVPIRIFLEMPTELRTLTGYYLDSCLQKRQKSLQIEEYSSTDVVTGT